MVLKEMPNVTTQTNNGLHPLLRSQQHTEQLWVRARGGNKKDELVCKLLPALSACHKK